MDNKKNNAVAWWLVTGVIMIIIQTLLGGITRLTGSGLSITEWKPIMGTIPPLNEKDWQIAFEHYRQIGQYKMLNYNFALQDFQSIYFWEWFHRLWARMLFVVFITGFLWFLIKGYLTKQMIRPFLVLLALGAFQGLIGWLMVKTGLNSDDVHVHYLALSVHFIAAMILASFTLWFALQLLVPEIEKARNAGMRYFTLSLIILTFLQLTYGSFMAGLKAALVAPSWPLINDVFIPQQIFSNGWVTDANTGALQLNIQFLHRSIAYLLLILLMVWFFRLRRFAAKQGLKHLGIASLFPIISVTLQVLLGICCLICAPQIRQGKFGIFEIFAEIHQLVAMFLLMSLVVNYYYLGSAK